MQRIARATGAIAVVLVALLAGCSGIGSDPPAPAEGYAPDDIGFALTQCATDGDTTLVLSSDDSAIDGSEALAYGEGDVGVVLVHQSDNNACAWDEYARELAEAGNRVLLPIIRRTEPAPVLQAASDWLRASGATRVVFVGASMGGTYVLASAPHVSPGPAAVIAVSPPTSFSGVDALSEIGDITSPVVIAAGLGDGGFPADARELADALPAAELIEIDSAAHGIALVRESAEVREAVSAAIDDARG